jgi:hypothetical protein
MKKLCIIGSEGQSEGMITPSKLRMVRCCWHHDDVIETSPLLHRPRLTVGLYVSCPLVCTAKAYLQALKGAVTRVVEPPPAVEAPPQGDSGGLNWPVVGAIAFLTGCRSSPTVNVSMGAEVGGFTSLRYLMFDLKGGLGCSSMIMVATNSIHGIS